MAHGNIQKLEWTERQLSPFAMLKEALLKRTICIFIVYKKPLDDSAHTIGETLSQQGAMVIYACSHAQAVCWIQQSEITLRWNGCACACACFEEVKTLSSRHQSVCIHGQCGSEFLENCAEFKPTSDVLGCVLPNVWCWDCAHTRKREHSCGWVVTFDEAEPNVKRGVRTRRLKTGLPCKYSGGFEVFHGFRQAGGFDVLALRKTIAGRQNACLCGENWWVSMHYAW